MYGFSGMETGVSQSLGVNIDIHSAEQYSQTTLSGLDTINFLTTTNTVDSKTDLY